MSKVALVVGCAAGVWKDVERAQSLYNFDAVYCVKQIGIYWPHKFDVWATLHPEVMDKYEADRKAKGFPDGYEIVAPLPHELGAHGAKGRIARRVSYRFKGMNASASSGIYAAKIAIEDGYRVVLAGVPMEKNAGHFLPGTLTIVRKEVRGAVWLEFDTFLEGFRNAKPFLRGKVTSMSGMTREVFGEPTPEWLRGDPEPVASAKVHA